MLQNVCTCGNKLTDVVQLTDKLQTNVIRYCATCIMYAYNLGYTDKTNSVTQKTDADTVMSGTIVL